jgi:cell division protein FtsW
MQSFSLISAEWIYFTKHMFFLVISLFMMIYFSLMNLRMMRRVGICLFLVSLLMLIAVPFIGVSQNNAKRWLDIGISMIQPAEFFKPGFVIFCAWVFSFSMTQEKQIPSKTITFLALIISVLLLLKQPDYGQSALLIAVWSIMFFMTGANLLWFIVLGGGLVGSAILLYSLWAMGLNSNMDHVMKRLSVFLESDKCSIREFSEGIAYQYCKAKEAFMTTDLWGKTASEKSIYVPESHTDYIFTKGAEEYGFALCVVLAIAFAFVIIRSMHRLKNETNPFVVIATCGLATLFGLQAFIHMGMNLGILPPKGMTLPLVSYGGSSMLGLGFTVGFLLCLTKRRVGESEY